MDTKSEIICIDGLIDTIVNQTTYSRDEAQDLLAKFDLDPVKVIKYYLSDGKEQKQEDKITSVNQEIYKQIRTRMGAVTTEYRKKNPLNLNHVKENFKSYDTDGVKNK